MALVLAIEPDLRQAAIVKRVIKEKVQADVAVVDSRDAAIEAIRTRMPDVLLLSALLSPRDEQELMGHLRTVENAEHLQTHTIPQLASSLQPNDEGQGLLGRFRRKKSVVSAGCDPDVFADEVRLFLSHAEEKKRERELYPQRSIVAEIKTAQAPAEAAPEPAPASGSSWDSPFEWHPSTARPRTTEHEPLIAKREPPGADHEPLIANRESPIESPEPLIAKADSPIRYSDLLPGSPVSSIHDRVEFPTAQPEPPAPSQVLAEPVSESLSEPVSEPVSEAVPEPSAEPVPVPEPPPDTLAPFFMFDRARGLRRDAARWMRVTAGQPATREARFTKGASGSEDEGLAMGGPIRVRIRSIRVRPAA